MQPIRSKSRQSGLTLIELMLVIMLNFLIAVLLQTYTKVMKDQQIILYKHRAAWSSV